jgi:hypothetical protein
MKIVGLTSRFQQPLLRIEMFRAFAIALLGVTVLMPLSQAQRGRVVIASGPHFGIQAVPRNPGFRSGQFARRSTALFAGDPFLLEYGDYQPNAGQAAPPQVVIVPAAPAPPEPAPVKLEPLMIEWRGDRYVRVANSSPAPLDYAAPSAPAPAATRTVMPAVLIFRDGSRQEITSYTIVGDSLYTDANRWVSGSWSRKIALASLDVPSTLRVNQERGVPFSLPSSPNEVMVRP